MNTKRKFQQITKSMINIKVIPLGTKVPQSKDNLSNDKDSINILYVGRFEPRKGIDLLLNAIPVVLQKQTKYKVSDHWKSS